MSVGKLSRQLFLLTLIGLLPAAVALFYNLHTIRQNWEDGVRIEALRSGQMAALEMERIVSGAENVLSSLSAAQAIQQFDVDGCHTYLQRATRQLPQFDLVVVVNASGVIVCSEDKGAVGLSIADRPYVQQALKTGKFVVGEYTMRRVVNLPMLPLAMPIKSDDGKVFSVMVGALSLDWLGQRMRERDFEQKSAVTIADRSGTILAREPFPKRFVGTKIPDKYMSFVSAAHPSTAEVVSQDGTRRMLGYYPPAATRYGLYISAGIAVDDAYTPIKNATWVSLTVTILSLVTSFVLATLTSRGLIQRPVQQLISTIRAWRGGDESVRTGMGSDNSEFGVVGKAIDEFLDALVAARQATARAEGQRELLVHELDHRIKNLLATVQSVARQTFKENDRLGGSVAGFTRRLTAMGEAHALLMKDNWLSAEIRDVVTAAIRPFMNESAPQFAVAGPDLAVKAKTVLSLSMALHELCTNAVKYGALKVAEGRIRIEWTIEAGESSGQVLRLLWAEENGPPVIPPEKFGFGSKMIERVLGYELEAEVRTTYAESGVVCIILAPMERIGAPRDVEMPGSVDGAGQ